MIDYTNIKNILDYDPVTGHFTWKVYRSSSARVGDRAGTKSYHGYRKIKFGRSSVLEHRLAFYFMTGRWPHQIDHINRDRSDNRWCNLRECNDHLNQLNTLARGKSGFKGVYKNKYGYSVYGHLNKYLGFTKDFDEACKMSKAHREINGNEFTRI